jgi:NDP-sugar pyrophosphorylase family protein
MKLKEVIEKPKFSFEDLFLFDIEIMTFTIDCKNLPEPNYSNNKIDYIPNLVSIVEELKKIHSPCLYWFETETIEESKEIFSLIENYRERSKLEGRKIPAKNNYFKENNYLPNKIIYVGKRHVGIRKHDQLTNIAGRIIIHFGYYAAGSTQGLQLANWSRKYNGKLFLKVLPLPKEADTYLELLEKLLAKKLKPLCGRH